MSDEKDEKAEKEKQEEEKQKEEDKERSQSDLFAEDMDRYHKG